jgi:hypothetical protein
MMQLSFKTQMKHYRTEATDMKQKITILDFKESHHFVTDEIHRAQGIWRSSASVFSGL